jgi:TonB family protein
MRRQDHSSALRAARSLEGAASSFDALTRWLIRHGARGAPASLSERLEEEWLADLAARSGPLARLRFAIGCCWASRVITHELAVAARTAAAAAGAKSVTLYAQPDPSLLSPRTAVLLLILCLHALVIYALGAGLARRVLEDITPPIRVSFAEQPAKIMPPPPLPPGPELTRPKVEVIERLIPLDTSPDGSAIDDVRPVIAEHPLAPTVRVAKRIIGGPGAGFPNTEDYYPAASRRIAEKGVATVEVCVDATGRLTRDPLITQSSGSARLDEGALKLARAGSGSYRPTTEDGRAVSSCYPYRIRFQLRD